MSDLPRPSFTRTLLPYVFLTGCLMHALIATFYPVQEERIVLSWVEGTNQRPTMQEQLKILKARQKNPQNALQNESGHGQLKTTTSEMKNLTKEKDYLRQHSENATGGNDVILDAMSSEFNNVVHEIDSGLHVTTANIHEETETPPNSTSEENNEIVTEANMQYENGNTNTHQERNFHYLSGNALLRRLQNLTWDRDAVPSRGNSREQRSVELSPLNSDALLLNGGNHSLSHQQKERESYQTNHEVKEDSFQDSYDVLLKTKSQDSEITISYAEPKQQKTVLSPGGQKNLEILNLNNSFAGYNDKPGVNGKNALNDAKEQFQTVAGKFLRDHGSDDKVLSGKRAHASSQRGRLWNTLVNANFTDPSIRNVKSNQGNIRYTEGEHHSGNKGYINTLSQIRNKFSPVKRRTKNVADENIPSHKVTVDKSGYINETELQSKTAQLHMVLQNQQQRSDDQKNGESGHERASSKEISDSAPKQSKIETDDHLLDQSIRNGQGTKLMFGDQRLLLEQQAFNSSRGDAFVHEEIETAFINTETTTGSPSQQGEILDETEIMGNCEYKSFPHAIIIGVSKCGTGALRYFLAEHPEISMEHMMSGVKFFRDGRYGKGKDWYLKVMPCSTPDQITMEQSPQYFPDKSVPKRIHDFNSSVKLIVILRDPTTRAISKYLQMQQQRPENITETFERSVYNYTSMEIVENSPLVSDSIYFPHMKRWLSYFPLQQIHFVDAGRFLKNPVAELKAIETFLGTRDYFKANQFPYIEERGVHCIKKKAKSKIKCLGTGKARDHPEIDPAVIQALRNYYRPFNKQLFQLIERRFNWE